jgi:hypothetical protein
VQCHFEIVPRNLNPPHQLYSAPATNPAAASGLLSGFALQAPVTPAGGPYLQPLLALPCIAKQQAGAHYYLPADEYQVLKPLRKEILVDADDRSPLPFEIVVVTARIKIWFNEGLVVDHLVASNGPSGLLVSPHEECHLVATTTKQSGKTVPHQGWRKGLAKVTAISLSHLTHLRY